MFVLRSTLVASGFVVAFGLAGCDKKPAASTATPGAAPTAKVEGAPAKLAVGAKAHCPVTGEEFVVAETTKQVEQDGKFYAFCCPECEPAFTKDPAKYIKKN